MTSSNAHRKWLAFFATIIVLIVLCVIATRMFGLNAFSKPDGMLIWTKLNLSLGLYKEKADEYESPKYFADITGTGHPNCLRFREAFPYFTFGRDGDMDIGFTMVVHKDPRQIARLMRMIHRPNNYYCIHIDNRSSLEFEEALNGISKCFGANVELVPKPERVAVNWGDETNLLPQFICGGQALRKHSTWRYLVNIVGQEFPLKTNREMIAAFKALNGSNLIEGVDLSIYRWRVRNKTLPLHVSLFSFALAKPGKLSSFGFRV